MDRKIESQWEGLMAAMVLARSDDKAKRFVHYGESIVDLVENGDYKTAINVGGEFAVEYVQLPGEEMSPVLRKYLGKVNDLLSLLPVEYNSGEEVRFVFKKSKEENS